MSRIVSGIVGISAILFIINAATQGMVWDHIVQLLFDPAKEGMRDTISCTIGVFLWTPYHTVGGLMLPVPSMADVLIAAIFTLVVLFIIFVLGLDHNWKHTILIFSISWIILKYTGFALIHISDMDCMSMVNEMNTMYGALAGILTLFGISSGWKILRMYKHI